MKRTLRPDICNLVGAAFGSYGWSGEAIKHLDQHLRAMGVELVEEGLGIPYVPDADALERCHQLGARVAQRMISKFDLA